MPRITDVTFTQRRQTQAAKKLHRGALPAGTLPPRDLVCRRKPTAKPWDAWVLSACSCPDHGTCIKHDAPPSCAPPQEAQDIFGDVNELLEMYESRKAAGAAARCVSLP